MNPRHSRQSSQGRKAPRPAPLTQRRSYTAQSGPSQLPSLSSPRKPAGPAACGSKTAPERPASKDEDEEFGMTSFLQFCTTCERQIVTPNPSILYCSSECRRRDSRPTSLEEIQTIQHALHSPPPASSTNPFFDRPIPEIVPSRLPTVVRPVSQTFSELSFGRYNESPSDHEFGEAYRECEPTNYLEQFYSAFNTQSTKPQRPTTKRTSIASTGTRSGGDSGTNLPSLSHSPSSSYGTVASNASFRPLMKHHPVSSSLTTKSVELVAPPHPTASISPTQLLKDLSLKSSASTLTAFRVAEASDASSYPALSQGYNKNKFRGRAEHTLKQLFRHDAMKASPK